MMHPQHRRRQRTLAGLLAVVAAVGALSQAAPASAGTAADTAADTAAGAGSGTAGGGGGGSLQKVCVVIDKADHLQYQAQVPAAAVQLLLRTTRSYPGGCARWGTRAALGDGSVRTFVQGSATRPSSIGVALTESALTGLPTEAHDGEHCFDVDGDGATDPMHECAGGHGLELDLPRRSDVPLQWTLLNWNPHGHGAPGIYDHPHFDFHFFLQSRAERDAIRPGPCGIVINCADFERATIPLGPEHLPRDYEDIQAAEVAMGNHLIDRTGPEWQGETFSRAFIYGAYDGRISFIEPMISMSLLQRVRTDPSAAGCHEIKQPQRWQAPGWYPTEYCIRYRPNRQELVVSMDRFRHSAAGPEGS